MLADGRDQELAVEAAMLDFDAADRVIEFAADQQALAAHFFDVRQRRELLLHILAHLLGVVREVAVEELIDLGERGGAGDRMAAERRAVRAHREGAGHFLRRADRADRHAAAERVRHRCRSA